MFNIRIYGILVNENLEVLVADEYIRGGLYTKFPGGGLRIWRRHKGLPCQEFMEEMNLRVTVNEHIYTTDFFQMSAFNPSHQIVSIYYRVTPLEAITAPIRNKPFDFDEAQMAVYHDKGEIETFRFIPMVEFSEETVTLPIDKIVARMVRDRYQAGS